jgi:hypothetical protein
MPIICVENIVADYAKFRAQFDANEHIRIANGMTNARVFRNADNGNHIAVFVDVADAAKAKQALTSPQYHARMVEGGLIGDLKVHVIE